MHGSEFRLQQLTSKAELLARYMAAELTIECHFCGHTETREMTIDDSRIGVALALHDRGWREVKSKHFQVVAPACPTCAKLPDAQRGEPIN